MEGNHKCILEKRDASYLYFIDQSAQSIVISIIGLKMGLAEPKDARVELLEGLIPQKQPRKPREVKSTEEEKEKELRRVSEISRLIAERDAKAIEDAERRAILLRNQAEIAARMAKEKLEHEELLRQIAKEQRERREQEIKEEMKLLQDKIALEEEYKVKTAGNRNECSICYERTINCVLLPCKHTITCKECAIPLKKCPLCRGDITDRMIVYI